MPFYRRKSFAKKTAPEESITLSEAKKKLMDLVARRDHSEKELRSKLSLRCSPEIVDQTLTWAREQNWLISPEKLKTQVAAQLSRNGKGVRKINQKLQSLGLDSVKSETEEELEKARHLVSRKWQPRDFKDLDFKESQKLKAKITRFLVARGFELNVVSTILRTDLKYTPSNEEEIYDEEL